MLIPSEDYLICKKSFSNGAGYVHCTAHFHVPSKGLCRRSGESKCLEKQVKKQGGMAPLLLSALHFGGKNNGKKGVAVGLLKNPDYRVPIRLPLPQRSSQPKSVPESPCRKYGSLPQHCPTSRSHPGKQRHRFLPKQECQPPS